MEDYAGTYRETRDAYLNAANELKLLPDPKKAALEASVKKPAEKPPTKMAQRDSNRETRDAYLKAANDLKLATGPYKAARDAYVAATSTYTKSLYE